MAMAALARRLRITSEPFFRFANERVHDAFPIPAIGSCHGVLEQEGFVEALVKRSFATRSTQLRRLAKQPVKRDGSRPIRDRVTSPGRKTTTGRQAAPGLGAPAKAYRKPWEAKRNAAPRKSPVQKLDRFQDLQLRRQGYEDVVDSKSAGYLSLTWCE